MRTEKRLFHYALSSKSAILFALLLLSIAVAAQLTGPFIAKSVIDRHITGIEEPWYRTSVSKHSVEYNGAHYTRSAYYLPAGERQGEPVQIMQIGTQFLFTETPLPASGQRQFNDGLLTVEYGGEIYSAPAVQLNAAEVMAFYRPEIMPIVRLLLLYLVLAAVAGVFQYGQRIFLQKAANRIIQRIRTDVFSHLSRLPVRFYDHQPPGKIVARVTNDTEKIRELFNTVLSTFFSGGIQIIGIYAALFILDVRLAVMTLVLLPIWYVWVKLYQKFASRYNHAILRKNSEINASLNENIQGMSILQAFRQENSAQARFKKINDEHFRFRSKLLNLNSLTSYNLANALQNVLLVTLIWMIGGGSGSGIGSMITLGVLYAFVDYLKRLFEPFSQMVNQLSNLEQARAAGQRVFALMDEEGTDVDDTTMERPQGEVVFDQVGFGYEEGEQVLRKVTFTAKPGETVAIVGHTGSGKSSIMNLLFRFYDSQEGRITIDGKDIQELSPQALREHMGIVLQDPYLFTGTLAANISLDHPGITRQQIEEAIRLVGGAEMVAGMKNGLDEEVTEKGSTLSSGQRQLISFARALVMNPAILVLDEATSSIDTETELMIQQGIQSLKEGRTTFIIAHRLSTIKDADQILVLSQGEIIEQGTHEELLALSGTYAHMYRLQRNDAA